MKRVKLTICYDGTRYHGWQVQNNALTVQQVLQDTLESVLGVRPGVTGCSRTDSGVHANRFVCHLDIKDTMPAEKLADALNAKLPDDIGVLSCEEVASDFHARYSVVSKEYIYKIYIGKYRNPFLKGYALHIKKALNLEKMREAAKAFLGRHDFTAFCSAGSSVEDKTRTVFSIGMEETNGLITIRIEADGFLYNMVRIIVGTLLAVSEGKTCPEEIEQILLSGKRSRAGKTAPACGLYLNQINYGGGKVG